MHGLKLKKTYFTVLKIGLITALALLVISLAYFIASDYQSTTRIFGESICRAALKTTALTFIVSFGGDMADKAADRLGKK